MAYSVASSVPTIDQRITSLLREQPRSLHDLVLGLWPGIWGGPRETALCGVNYVRTRVDALQRTGRLLLQEDRLHLVEQLDQEVVHAA